MHPFCSKLDLANRKRGLEYLEIRIVNDGTRMSCCDRGSLHPSDAPVVQRIISSLRFGKRQRAVSRKFVLVATPENAMGICYTKALGLLRGKEIEGPLAIATVVTEYVLAR